MLRTGLGLRNCLPVAALFMGSFLLFGVQPMTGRTLLPVFGGTASVWTVCLAAFQALLVGGYLYAHWMALWSAREPKRAGTVHISLLLLAAAGLALANFYRRAIFIFLPDGIAGVLLCVLVLVGGQFMLLSANASLIQAWVSGQRRDVYWLYGVSNVGSFCGLLAYPFVVEPLVPLTVQWYGVAVLLGMYAVLLCAVVVLLRPGGVKRETVAAPVVEGSNARPKWARWALWLLLPAVGTFLLNAVTAHLLMDVSPMPLMWTLTLGLFLWSYIVGFSPAGERRIGLWAGLCAGSVLWGAVVLSKGGGAGFWPNLCAGCMLVLTGCAFLHSWLYRSRPGAKYLTAFYFCLASGGALGGILASVGGPLVLNNVAEYPAVLIVLAAAVVAYWRQLPHAAWRFERRVCLAGLVLFAAFVCYQADRSADEGVLLVQRRNFYGQSRVRLKQVAHKAGGIFPVHFFYHGSTVHGGQSKREEAVRHPVLYYGQSAGGQAIVSHPRYAQGEPLRVAVLGAGTGTLACYGRTNDVYRFYEINPQVVEAACNTNWFTFLSDCPAKVEIVVDDARRALEKEVAAGDEKFDVIVLDVYSGDAIPLHLATREAFEVYLSRLKDDGVLALHLTNWHLNLMPLAKAVGQTFKLHSTGLVRRATDMDAESFWAFLSRKKLGLNWTHAKRVDWSRVGVVALQTDEQCSLLPYLSDETTPPLVDDEQTL